MEQKKEKGLRIRSCLTGAIWLALVFSTVISALLFAFLNHFFNLPGSIPVLGWLLIFNTLKFLGEILNSIWKRTAV